MSALTHQERAERAYTAIAQDFNRPGREHIETIARETFPAELLAVLRRYVTFHQGHVLPPGLAQTQDDARVVLALYGENEL